ncbi:hypothetical protein FDUTEX481_05639 [Tolypothrix sp. PCC 7601]|nr:hypothetical protein FDUTEX481_05639 [Tolypothrix sp. PCC 7601]
MPHTQCPTSGNLRSFTKNLVKKIQNSRNYAEPELRLFEASYLSRHD